MPAISQVIVQQHFTVGDNARTRAEKGRVLEDLICYLFGRVPGITVTKRNTVNVFDSEEIDVAFWNEQRPKGLYFLPHIILVECKNWSKPVDSAEVNWFDAKLKRRALPFGILIAANGITGNGNEVSSAHEIIRVALGEGRQLVVITRQEIEALTTTEELVRLTKEKLCELAVAGTLFI